MVMAFIAIGISGWKESGKQSMARSASCILRLASLSSAQYMELESLEKGHRPFMASAQ